MTEAHRYETSVVWLRRDLRLTDNVALFEACRSSRRVCIAFVVNPPLLRDDRMGAPLVTAFFDALEGLRRDIRSYGSDLVVLTGDFEAELLTLIKRVRAQALFYNVDYEPDAIDRDTVVRAALEREGVAVQTFVDHVYFGADEVLSADGSPYRIFSPYRRRWREQRAVSPRHPVPSRAALRNRLMRCDSLDITGALPKPHDYGFESFGVATRVSEAIAHARLAEFLSETVARYADRRNVPSKEGTSRLSVHLRAGTIGIRTCVESAYRFCEAADGGASAGVQAWVDELIWRDFYQMILKNFPAVTTSNFLKLRPIAWESANGAFDAWCDGQTGYPIVDAGMRQLNSTGWMHNRLRMITASFLTKHLLIDWRRGERYFERRLIDADRAQNNGGWQWAASTGTDAAPYFRIFNPIAQGRRFDPDGLYIKQFVSELRNVPSEFVHAPWTMPPLLQASIDVVIGRNYPAPIVDHREARDRAIGVFRAATLHGGGSV